MRARLSCSLQAALAGEQVTELAFGGLKLCDEGFELGARGFEVGRRGGAALGYRLQLGFDGLEGGLAVAQAIDAASESRGHALDLTRERAGFAFEVGVGGGGFRDAIDGAVAAGRDEAEGLTVALQRLSCGQSSDREALLIGLDAAAVGAPVGDIVATTQLGPEGAGFAAQEDETAAVLQQDVLALVALVALGLQRRLHLTQGGDGAVEGLTLAAQA